MPKPYVLHQSQLISRSLSDTFAFFEDAANLQAITPPSLHFLILPPLPITMCKDTIIDYQLKLLGFPFKWKTRITEYSPPHFFVDEQIRGPYQQWTHRHDFSETEHGTRMVDRVDYSIRWGPLGGLAHQMFVKRMLHSIFDYRHQQIERLLS